MRLAYYAGVSTAAAAACLLKAFHQRPNYYSATVYLAQSNACLLILTNLVMVIVCSFIYGLQRLLYGPLRPIEIEQLSDKAWYAVLDTLLAMPSFREELNGALLAMFTLLLAGKVWGWIGEGRVDVLEQQPPANPRLFHLRLATSLIMSVAFDFYMMDYCIETVLADPRPGMMVIFTFEFAILGIFSLFTLARYGLSVLQIRIEKQQIQKAIEERKMEIKEERAAARQNETAEGRPAPADPPNEEPIEVDENEVNVPGWEEKRRYLFALEVFTDFIKLVLYIVFFTVSITFNGLPMHIMRDVYMTFASFTKRVSDYIAYRKATSDMNSRYPDATTEEIRDDSCIVCREAMVAWAQPEAQPPPGVEQQAAPAPAAASRQRDEGLRAKKLPCGHILHLRCLKAWLERQQVCPTCRRPVVAAEETAPGGAARGANNQQPGQQRQAPARRDGRARIFNLGPVRIGFLNGPGDQINNIVRQMQNAQAGGAGNGGQQEANQGNTGVGALGTLTNNSAQTNGTGSDSTQAWQSPLHAQLSQLEQRLLNEAHNLNIAQQQLASLRAMEAELNRLRTLHIALSGSSDDIAAQQRQSAPPQPFIQPLTYPTLTTMNTLVGRPNGSTAASEPATLPPGLVLPEGWSIMPLQRVDAGSAAVPNLSPGPIQIPTMPGAHSTNTTAANFATNGTVDANGGPTDHSGSPLFVPTASLATAEPSVNGAASLNHSAIDETATSSRQGSASTATSEDQRQGHIDKGKGRAVEVEDVPDPGT